ncbi:MAG TPA: hypothetical protein QGG32_04750 [Rhodospirillales bacterium]|nr:hypothetical protein [Rhodospirillales bacterium]
MARLLAQSVAAELDTQRVLASVGVAGDSRYVLRGRAERNRDNNRVPLIVVIKWDLVDASSKLVCNHSQGVEGTWWQWEYGDPRIIRSVGKVAAKPIVAMIRVEPDTVPPGAPQPANLLIEEVKGAPGDGNSALTREMKVAAKAAGIATTELPDVATHVLQGVVRAEAPSGRASAGDDRVDDDHARRPRGGQGHPGEHRRRRLAGRVVGPGGGARGARRDAWCGGRSQPLTANLRRQVHHAQGPRPAAGPWPRAASRSVGTAGEEARLHTIATLINSAASC